MKTKVSPSLVGAFVLGALALAFTALMVFGGVNFFAHPERFEVYFREPSHGLDIGSPVQLLGVRVGRVVDLETCATIRRRPTSPWWRWSANWTRARSATSPGRALIDITVPGQAAWSLLVDRGLAGPAGGGREPQDRGCCT